MDFNMGTQSAYDEFHDPRGTPSLSERLGHQEEVDKHKNNTFSKHTGKIREDTNGDHDIEDNQTAHGDVLMWDLDDVSVAHTGNTSDHLTPRMTTPSTIKIPTIPTTSDIEKELTPAGLQRTPHHAPRPIYSPSDAMDTYRFRDLFPNPELKKEMTNRLGKMNAGGAFVVDNNITMHGDVMMLDLDGEGEGHSSQTYTAVEKFSQLTETPMTVTGPTKVRATTTGIRHLMTIRNPDFADHPSGIDINPDKKRRKKKRSKKSKNGKLTGNVARVSETEDTKKPASCIVTPTLEVVNENNNTKKKPMAFTKLLRCQMSRFGAYIQKKLMCR